MYQTHKKSTQISPQSGATQNGKPQQQWLDAASLPIATIMLGLGLIVQSYTFMNHDVAWVLYSSREMLSGSIFGKDIIAANPPLIWWISLLPNWFSKITDLPVIGVYRIFVFLLSISSIFVMQRLLYRSRNQRPSQIIFLTATAWLLAFAIHRDFGQREHFAVILTLPYIAAIINRVESQPVGLFVGLAIGIAAGIGIALKPYFVFVPLLLEGWLVWRTRNSRMLVRPEAIGAAAAVLAYATALIIFAPIWLSETASEIHKVYWAFERTSGWLPLMVSLALPTLLTLWTLSRNHSNLGTALLLGAIGFFVAAVIQGKLYSYHIYPAYMLLVVSGFAGINQDKSPRVFLTITLTIAVAIQSGIMTWSNISNRTASGPVGQSIDVVSKFVREQVPIGGSFISISTHPFPGFPTALYAERPWGSRSNSRIFLPAVIRLNEGWTVKNKNLLDYAEAKAIESLARDLEQQPDLILVDIKPIRHAIGSSDFDFISFYMQHEKTRRLLSEYHRVESAPAGFAAYILRKNLEEVSTAE